MPVHLSNSKTRSGVIKSWDIRDAKTMWAAAARIFVSMIRGATPNSGRVRRAGGEIVGCTGLVVRGGSSDLTVVRAPPQQAARW